MADYSGRVEHISPDQVLRLEAQALVDAAEHLDHQAFDAAVALLEKVAGKVLITGAGTSGIIARKMAATFTSTGTPAMFLHPGDAMHGGLGIVSEDDVVVAVSNSGETEEILAALPYMRSRNVPVVAVVGSTTSTLAKQADVVLDAGVSVEACPLDIVPTSSTTLAMALGDAVALVLMQRKGVTADAFARNHPSGRLGRRLTLRVSDLMHPSGTTVTPTDPWLDAVQALTATGLGAVAVLEHDALVGIVTDGDIRRGIARLKDQGTMGSATVEHLMTRGPVTVEAEDLAYTALRLMEERESQISVLPVVCASGLVGLLRLHDLVRAGL